MTWYRHNSGQITEHRIAADDHPVIVLDLGPRQAEFVADVLENTRHEWTLDVAQIIRAALLPDEPQGLGAVVVEANGDRYVRAAEGECGWAKVNSKSRKDSSTLVNWVLLEPVRILSPGVES